MGGQSGSSSDNGLNGQRSRSLYILVCTGNVVIVAAVAVPIVMR